MLPHNIRRHLFSQTPVPHIRCKSSLTVEQVHVVNKIDSNTKETPALREFPDESELLKIACGEDGAIKRSEDGKLRDCEGARMQC